MASPEKPDPRRWQKDIYVGWVPWRLVRWWSANKLWVIAAFFVSPPVALLFTGVAGLISTVVILVVSFTIKLFRDHRRGIGFTHNKEIVIFGPHAPIVIPSSSIQSLGVMKANRVLAFNLQGEDADIMPDQDRWYQKMFGLVGFKSDAPIRAKDAAAAREMSLASGRGLLVVVRDTQGTFWTVSTATGYEVATLRDLAALAKVRFISPGDPFGRRPAPNRSPKRQNHKKVNRAKIDDLPDRELLRGYGLHQLRSMSRLHAFIVTNTSFRDGQLPEEWVPKLGLQTPSDAVMSKSRRRTRLLSGGGLAAVVILVMVLPVVAMSAWPVVTGGLLTSSWPRPYERLWEVPDGWVIREKNNAFMEAFNNSDPESVVRIDINFVEGGENECAFILQDAAFETFVQNGVEIPDESPPTTERDGWLAMEIEQGRSIWCKEERQQNRDALTLIDAENMTVDESYEFISGVKSRINI